MKNTLILAIALAFAGCSSSDSANQDQYIDVPLAFETPSNFPPLVYDIASNRPTQKGFELGKKLFYDGRLSSDGTVSCGFCHEQSSAFTHHGHTLSQGVDGQLGTRNTPSIQNLAFQTQFMYDGAADHMDLQPIIPLMNPVEMNANMAAILQLLRSDATYVQLFGQAFPGKPIDSEHMLKAMSQFMLMITSSNSRFDKYRLNEAGGTLSADELQGYAVFNQKCASCHSSDLFTDDSFRNNGLAVNPLVNDVGRYRVTELESDRYKFKVPSLRNVEKTAPYMHDGRFGTLEAVLSHYTNGVQPSATLDPLLQQNAQPGIVLSATEKTQLIAFLKTLTDQQYLNDPRFAEF
ncbi:cytochrome-c peroxidase [Flavobacterium caeni]|uniref:Cytochrome c peroxidase n=1 Tax=Flavobacterium caeni TaxID=490189 RepID=A0A1G5J359_9FLAO|nr:cytochrome c peroxidase [Flavobacterium caeni]SCY82785.1 cytochrome c peroxidase [Flavobacterium caeni]